MRRLFETFRYRRFARDDRAQALAEFAIAFPLQLFVTFGVAQLILIYVSTLVVNFAAYRACRAEIVGGDPEVAAQLVLSPLTSSQSAGFEVDPAKTLLVPGWGTIRNSQVALAKSQVYAEENDDGEDVTVVVEYHQELIFPVVDGLFALFLDEAPDESDGAQLAYGVMDSDATYHDRVHEKGGPYIRDYGGGVRYIVISRECTMYRDPVTASK